MILIKLKGKVAIVTGATKGIGFAIAKSFAREGCNLVICARNQKDIDTKLKELQKFNVKVIGILADVRDSKDVKKVVDRAVKEFGGVDILVNNAGLWYKKFLHDTTEEEYDITLDTNLKGVFLFSKYVVPIMIKRREGVVINISSGAGKYGSPFYSVYCASKFAVTGLTESLAREAKQFGIKVFAVCPGGVNTEGYRSHHPNEAESYFRSLMQPEEVAEVVLKLATGERRVESGSAVDVF